MTVNNIKEDAIRRGVKIALAWSPTSRSLAELVAEQVEDAVKDAYRDAIDIAKFWVGDEGQSPLHGPALRQGFKVAANAIITGIEAKML